MHLRILVVLFDIVNNKSVPTYLIRKVVYIPIVLSLDAFRIVVFLAYSILAPIQEGTIRDASTLIDADSNCALNCSKLPKSFMICSINA